jgi:hypothetical protein
VRLLETSIVIPPAHRVLKHDETITFDHIDGMYSYCKDAYGNIVHPAAWSEVEVVK